MRCRQCRQTNHHRMDIAEARCASVHRSKARPWAKSIGRSATPSPDALWIKKPTTRNSKASAARGLPIDEEGPMVGRGHRNPADHGGRRKIEDLDRTPIEAHGPC